MTSPFARRPSFAALLLALGATVPAAGQATRDQPTLTMGIAGGYVLGSQDFWSVSGQPIVAPEQQRDLFDLSRRLTGNVVVSVQATLFQKPHFGYSAEVTYLGIGTSDKCVLARSTGYALNRAACEALNRDNRSTSATSFLVGGVVRPFARKFLQPYVRAMGGVSAITDNLVAMTAYIGPAQNLVVPIYPSEGSLSFRPTGVLGLGVVTNSGGGYLFRVEARRTWLSLNRVTGASEQDAIEPPTATGFRGFSSVLIGFDIVLEKSRGRRY